MPQCSDNMFYINMPTSKAQSRSNCPTDIKMEFGISCDTGTLSCSDVMSQRPNRSKTKADVIDAILLELGAPVIRIELDQQQIDYSVDKAMRVFEEWAGREFLRIYVFQTLPGKSVYEMPDDVGFIRNVHHRRMPNPAFSSTDLGGAIPLEFMYGSYSTFGFLTPTFPVWGNTAEWTLYKQYEQMYNRTSSALGGWEWIGDYHHIKLYPIPCHSQQVIVQYIQKCTDFGREAFLAIQEGACALCKIMLGRIRSKYGNPPGPNGGIILDGSQILQEGQQEYKDWEQRLITRYGEFPAISIG